MTDHAGTLRILCDCVHTDWWVQKGNVFEPDEQEENCFGVRKLPYKMLTDAAAEYQVSFYCLAAC